MSSSIVVPVSIITTNSNGLQMELIDHYIKERGEEPEHKSVLSSLVGVGSKESKLNAAKRIKLFIEAGEDLEIVFNEVHAQLADKGELRRVFDEYKQERINTISRMNTSRMRLPKGLQKFSDNPLPVSVKNKHGIERITEYYETRSADPRDTKGIGASIASLFGNDSYTKAGKLRAAKLLENAIQAGVPLVMVYNTESGAFGDGTLKGIYELYEKEQEKVKQRLLYARKQLNTTAAAQNTALLSTEHDSLREKYSRAQ
mmetsp:Transcript_32209/g.55076  ORF Transcript_32209/g.55076 Transcript_32209/m.55076 type:complete len:258 (-) Transcript_32209:3-776(-)